MSIMHEPAPMPEEEFKAAIDPNGLLDSMSSSQLPVESEVGGTGLDAYIFPDQIIQEGLTVSETAAVPSDLIIDVDTRERPSRDKTAVVIRAPRADAIMRQREWEQKRVASEAEHAAYEEQLENEPLEPVYLSPIEESPIIKEALTAFRSGAIDENQFRQQIWPELETRFDAMRHLPVIGISNKLHGSTRTVPAGDQEVDVYRIVKYSDFLDRAGYDAERFGVDSSRKIADIVVTKLIGTYDEINEGLAIMLIETIDRNGEKFYSIDNGQHRIGAAIMMGRRTVMAEVSKYPTPVDVNIRRRVNSDQSYRRTLLESGGAGYGDAMTRVFPTRIIE